MAKLSPWIQHVMKTRRSMPKGTSLGAAMKKAKGTYKHHKKGGALGLEGEGESKVEQDLAQEPEFEEGGRRRRRRTRRHSRR